MATILVVDDDESLLELLRMHLGAAGYDVQMAEDAIAAGYIVLRSPPDLIICDVHMPHMDGFEFVAALPERSLASTWASRRREPVAFCAAMPRCWSSSIGSSVMV